MGAHEYKELLSPATEIWFLKSALTQLKTLETLPHLFKVTLFTCVYT